jgi:hypothetical protein
MAIAPIVLMVATKMIALIVGTIAGLKCNSIFGDYFLGREGGGVFVIRSCMLDIEYTLVSCSST